MTIWSQIMGVFAAVLPGESAGYDGYLEADYVYVAPLSPGRIIALDAAEGDHVTAGQVLVRLDDQAQRAGLAGAEAAVAQAEANLDNLSTGSRAAEIAVIQASVRKAEADRDPDTARQDHHQEAQQGERQNGKAHGQTPPPCATRSISSSVVCGGSGS